MNREDLEKLSRAELVELVLKLQHPSKTSRTSSQPPSMDRKARREQSRPGGAKPGHEGHHRRLCDAPDAFIDHRPAQCPDCGRAIPVDHPGEVIGEYDWIDLPPHQPVVERHRRLSCACPGCGGRVKAAVPEAAAGSPFGPRISALAFYFRYIQHVSYQRLERLFHDICGLRISQGALGNILRRGSVAFEARKSEILAQLRGAEAVASDETGVRIEGQNAQQWVFRSNDVVLHEMAFSRGAQVVRDVMDGHRPRFWLSDRYSAQQGHAEQHQTCLAHLARDAARVLQLGCERIGLSLKLWFDAVFALAQERADLAASTLKRKRRELEGRIIRITNHEPDCAETAHILRKIARARDQLLSFLDAPPGMLEPTNNACERALRPAVIGRKITNGFRSHWGANADAALRSCTDTAALKGSTPFSTIKNILGT